jgi:hypothetical protein
MIGEEITDAEEARSEERERGARARRRMDIS